MRVGDILKRKGSLVATVPPNARVSDAVTALHERGIGAVVVSSDGGSIDGILSERDIVRALHRTGAAVLDESIASIMTSNVVTCRADDRVDAMMSLMTENRIRHLPVAENGRLSGIISIGDVVASRVAELENETRVMEEYIQHGR